MRGDETKYRIKLAARRLFSERGINGVSIREIVAAAGQRNVGSLHYYFRTKEALVRELIVDGAQLIDERRNILLDELDRQGGPKSLRDITDILIMPAIGQGVQEEEETYFRFLIMLQLNHRKLLVSTINKQWTSGYDRCIAHIKRLLVHVPPPLLKQRIFFVTVYLSVMLAARESGDSETERRHPLWTRDYTMANLADTAQAVLECGVSAQTMAVFAPAAPVKQKQPRPIATGAAVTRLPRRQKA